MGGDWQFIHSGIYPQIDWELISNSYNGIDVGLHGVPTFCDIDNDGDYDLFIGEYEGKIFFYQNDGTPQSPIWTFITDYYNSIDVGHHNSPTFCDIDNDGDYDMFIGRGSGVGGRIAFYRNDGIPESPDWTFVTDNYNGISMDYNCHPDFCDIDNDEDYDLFIGSHDGKIYFYRNDGSPESPDWTFITNNYYGIDVVDDALPFFVDIDNDDDYDMFIGGQDGRIYFYKNDGITQLPIWSFITANYYEIDVGMHSSPTFCDIDDDGDNDMFIGEFYRYINFYEQGFESQWDWDTVRASGDSTQYKIKIVVSDGESFAADESDDYFTIDNPQPESPQNFAGTVEGIDRIRWSWDDVEDETGYRIYNAENNQLMNTFSSYTHYWLQTQLTQNTSYHYYVKAYNQYGESLPSNSVLKYTFVNRPTNLSIESGSALPLILVWEGNGGSRFEVEVSLHSDFHGLEHTVQVAEETTTVTDLLLDIEYWFKVRGFNGDNVPTDYSNIVNIRLSSTMEDEELEPLAIPVINSVMPTSGKKRTSLYVNILGENFTNGDTVSFSGSGITVNTIELVAATVLKVYISISNDAKVGKRNVTVTNIDDGSATLTECFTVREGFAEAAGQLKIQGGAKGYVNLKNGETAKIHFNADGPGTVYLKLYTVRGQLVWEDSKTVAGGEDYISWICQNTNGNTVSSGVYIVYVTGPGIKETRKLALLR